MKMVLTARNKDIPELYRISGNCFGKDYISSDDLKLYTEDKRIILFSEENTTKGFLIYFENKTEFIIKTLCVDTNYQRQGIGNILLEHTLSTLCTGKPVKYYGWKEGLPEYFSNKLIRSGFVITDTIPNYWKEDSIKRNYKCPECDTPCKCTMQVYELKVR